MNYAPVWLNNPPRDADHTEIEFHPVFNRLLAGLPVGVKTSFTNAQLAVLSQACKPPPPRHWLDYRVSVPFFGARFYLTVFFGKERRSENRLKAEGYLGIKKVSLFYIFMLWLAFSGLFFVAAMALYFVKSAIGLDLLDDHSVVHHLFFK